MPHKDKEQRAKYMRDYRARQKGMLASHRSGQRIITITTAETLAQFLREDMGFECIPLDWLIEVEASIAPEKKRPIMVYFRNGLPGYCIAIPEGT